MWSMRMAPSLGESRNGRVGLPIIMVVEEELFDMINDPDETTNLLAAQETCECLRQSFPSESVSAVREELHAALVEQEKRYDWKAM